MKADQIKHLLAVGPKSIQSRVYDAETGELISSVTMPVEDAGLVRREWQGLTKELDGVIVDVEEGDGFDDVCLDTVKYVRDQLAAAPKREWQGLTDEEMHQCWGDPLTPLGMKHARMIEAKLKEKNT